ncbi:MAG: D-galactarate dehydratase [Yoonia sp.]|nr:D-galactarate dehydratase [Yoonia sp.]
MKYVVLFPVVVLAGCASPSLQGIFKSPQAVAPVVDVAAPAPVIATLDPTPPPPPAARTVAQFDTTTAEDRAAATAAPEPESETELGTTIATLGSPADPGIWLKTPLVTELVAGRVEYGANGKSVNLELRPSGGEAGSGSQISLPAMRLLDAPLTGLLELVVYKN